MTDQTTAVPYPSGLFGHLGQIADDDLELTPTQRDFAVEAAVRIYCGIDDEGLALAIDTIGNAIAEEIDHLVESATAFAAAKLDRDVS
jgi:hypothetical protein